MNLEDSERRYRTDATFRQMVDVMLQHVITMQFTPADMREAAMYASLRFEAEYRRIQYRVDGEIIGS